MMIRSVDIFERLEDPQVILSLPVIVGTIAWIVLFIWQCILVSKGKICNRGRKQIEDAIREGRVVEAHFSSGWETEIGGKDGANQSRRFHRRYVYEVNGKQYRRTIISRKIRYSDVITLYYNSSPAKAKTRSEMIGIMPSVWPLVSSLAIASSIVVILMALGF